MRKCDIGLLWLGNCEIQSAMTLSVVETQLELILMGLLSIRPNWRHPRAFPGSDFLALLMIHALESILFLKSRNEGN